MLFLVRAAPPGRPPPVSRPPPPCITSHEKNRGKIVKEPEPEEDAWTQFKKMSKKVYMFFFNVNDVVKSTEDRLKTLSETTTANEIIDESYLAEVGGSQGIIYASTHKEIRRKMEEQKNEKLLKKKLKQQGKKMVSPTYDPSEEDNMDRAAQELALKMASMRTDLERHTILLIQSPFKIDKLPDGVAATEPSSENVDPFAAPSKAVVDPFVPTEQKLIEDDYDPFAVRPVEDIVAAAKAKAEEARLAKEAQDDLDFFGGGRHSPALSTPTPEGGSPISHRPVGFEDDFKCEEMDLETPTPLYDEDDSEPLADFIPKFDGDGWELMIRHPIKKKSFMVERYWKPCYVRLHGTTLLLYNNKTDGKPIQNLLKIISACHSEIPVLIILSIEELLLQATYSLSDTTLQAYDVYGKIHTVKLQYVLYKEKVGIRPVLPTITRKMASDLNSYPISMRFVKHELEFYPHEIRRIHMLTKKMKINRYEETITFLSMVGQNHAYFLKAPLVEIVIRLSPPDGCFFEVMRFRIRPPRNREKALTIKAIMKIAGSKVEIRIEAMAAAQVEKSKGGKSTRRQIPCEDIAIRFPVPEAWIYIFREERHWGIGSVHSKKLRPGKVKVGVCSIIVNKKNYNSPILNCIVQNLKDRLLGAVQSNEYNLIECAIGEAKYEHVYRSLVWRIPRLPEKHHAAYKAHLLK
uniref:ERCC4 domain-containing protein n=1 Tax=Heterorhabditis bacteriophora TaxID=37862 RepID=A0A1I7XFV7_HETBA